MIKLLQKQNGAVFYTSQCNLFGMAKRTGVTGSKRGVPLTLSPFLVCSGPELQLRGVESDITLLNEV